MKQKIKGRLYRCGNLKDHCLCPLFNCCIWSFEAAYPLPPSARSPPGWRPPRGQGTLGDSTSNGSAAGISCFQDILPGPGQACGAGQQVGGGLGGPPVSVFV